MFKKSTESSVNLKDLGPSVATFVPRISVSINSKNSSSHNDVIPNIDIPNQPDTENVNPIDENVVHSSFVSDQIC